MYRGMIGDNGKSIPSLLVLSQHWGIHYSKYKKRGEDMPVAVFYGGDPVLQICSATPIQHPGCSEYEVAGAIRGEPVELVKCETSDLYVPVSSEIIVEGRISSDPTTFELEGPFGEYTGFYGGARQPKPTIRVECITYREGWGKSEGSHDRLHGHFIDPTDMLQVNWAIGTRCEPENSIHIIKGCWGSLLDPLLPPEKKARSQLDHSTAIILACKPYSWIKEFPASVKTSSQLMQKTKEKWGKFFEGVRKNSEY